MDFSSDANANFEGLLAVNREICMTQMAEKTSPDAPPNCAVVPLYSFCMDWQHCAGISPLRRRQKGNGNGRSPRSSAGHLAFATPVAGFYRCIVPFVLEFSGFLLLN